MKSKAQRGSALIFALILLLVLSAMAGSLMFLSNSETYSSMNYRTMAEARYGAEAGVNAAANFLMSANYVPPAAPAPGAEFPGYNTLTAYPVQTGGGDVILSTIPGTASTYPDGAMVAAFQRAMNTNQPLQQAGQNGANTVNYFASARLMSMVSIIPFGTTKAVTIQTWEIKGHGDIVNVQNGEAEVVTTLERYISPSFSYAAFADGGGCGQLSFTGNGTTNGYDSGGLPVVGGAVQAPTGANLLGYGGDVGTNGNESDSGSNVQINGTLSTPNSGFGACSAGNLTALSGKSLNQVTGGLVQMPAPVTFPNPNITPPPAGSPNVSTTATLGPTNPLPANCVTSQGQTTCNYGDINLSGKDIITLTPGTYNINSLSISGSAQIVIGPYPPGSPNAGQYGPVVVNVAGQNTVTPITITGNGISNPTYDPSTFQILCCYQPPAPAPPPPQPTIKIAGNGASAAVVYAPNSIVDMKGNGTFYGSIIANQLADVGNGAIYYDMKLKKKLFTIGNYVLNAFTWNKY
ncbi:MAG TPA: PilX N-terminal domain-containing pilus assembly protein [Candidatus Acidoferrum sp.]|nr:PilX N-terminal domain-containing pilus assembly protein [Candidatus Acidoferrum sp.]